MANDMQSVRREIHRLLDVEHAAAILDLGCGTGTDLISIATTAPHGLRLVGIDSSANAIDVARSHGARDRIQWLVHDATTSLPFADRSFDRVLSVNLLEAIPDKAAFLGEVRRMLKPGGRVVIAHWDWDSQLFDGEDKELVRRVVHAFADWKQAWMADADGWMGRRLWKTVQAAGLFKGEMHAFVHTSTDFKEGSYGYDRAQDFRSLAKRSLISSQDYEEVKRGLEQLAAADQYFYSITMFVYVGS